MQQNYAKRFRIFSFSINSILLDYRRWSFIHPFFNGLPVYAIIYILPLRHLPKNKNTILIRNKIRLPFVFI